jgi:hypothetical protein
MPILPTNLLRPTRFISRASRLAALACLLGVSCLASAQLFFDSNPDWKEASVPPPPAFNEGRLVPIEMPVYMSLKFGVDPATITVTGDGVVRYVVVASNRAGGAINAFYEGVRCETAEVRTYARWGSNAWDVLPQTDWKRMATLNSSYAKQLATQGLCRGSAPRASVTDMVQHLKNPVREIE